MGQLSLVVSFTLVILLFVSRAETKGCSAEPEGPCSPFKVAFSNAIHSSKDRYLQFYVSLPPQIAYKVFLKLSLQAYTALHALDAEDIAHEIAKAGQCKLNGVTPEEYANVCSNAVEHFLNVQGILTNENAALLALTYVKLLDEARNAPGRLGTPQSNLKSLYDATVNFVKGVAPNAANNAEIVFQSFDSELKALPCHCG